MFLPVHFSSKSRFRCNGCGRRFTGRRNLTDAILMLSYGGAIAFLGALYPVALVFLGLWMAFTVAFKARQGSGPIDTFIACLLVCTLWFLALVLKVRWLEAAVRRDGAFVFGLFVFGGLGLAYVCLLLDMHTFSAPRPLDAAPKEPSER